MWLTRDAERHGGLRLLHCSKPELDRSGFWHSYYFHSIDEADSPVALEPGTMIEVELKEKGKP